MSTTLRLASFLLIGSLLSLATGCGADSHESLAKTAMGHMESFVKVIENVTDQESAKQAKGKIEAIGTKLKALKERMDKLPKATAEQEKEIIEMMKGRQEAFAKRMNEAMAKLMTQPDVLTELSKSMDQMKQFDF